MASMATKVKHIRDVDPAVELRAAGLAAVTATGQSVGLSLQKLTLAYWDNGEIPWAGIGAQLVVSALDFTTSDETYRFSLEVSADLAFTVPVEVAGMTVTSVGGYILQVDADTVKDRLPAAAFIRLKHTLAGTTPIATYYGWLVHVPF